MFCKLNLYAQQYLIDFGPDHYAAVLLRILLPIALQNFTFKVERILSGRLDRVEFPRLCKIINILSAAAQDFCGFGYIHNPVHNKILEVRNCQRNFCAGTIQCSRANIQINIPFDAMSSRLKIDSIKELFVFE